MMREALISKTALLHNVQILKKKVGASSRILAFLKAHAYGHDLKWVAQTIADQIEGIAVSSLDEVDLLKTQGIQTPIILTSQYVTKDLCESMADQEVQLVIHHLEHLEILKTLQLKRPLSIWLKVNTGMNRLGIPLNQLVSTLQVLKGLKHIEATVTLMTHYATAEVATHLKTQEQYQHFMTFPKNALYPVCASNSAAIWTLPTLEADWVRPGISLYGVSPLPDQCGHDLNLKPVMTLRAQIISIQSLDIGDTVGYGCRWSATTPTDIAVVALGYADGIPWNTPDGTQVMVNGIKYPIVGRVSMDLITLNLGVDHAVNIGDWTIFWGPELPVENFANAVKTSPYELLCRVGPRVQRRLIES